MLDIFLLCFILGVAWYNATHCGKCNYENTRCKLCDYAEKHKKIDESIVEGQKRNNG